MTVGRLTLNRIVSGLIFADLALLAGWGLINPVFGVFVTDGIAGGSLAAVGVAVAIFWFTRSLLQVPIASHLDRTPGEKDEYRALAMGLMIAATAAFLMPLATTVTHVYLIEFVHAVGFAFYIPAWSTVFTHHVDPEHTALEWALDRSVGGLATGASGLLGGVVAAAYGFDAVFIAAGVLSLLAVLGVMAVPSLRIPKGLKKARRPWETLVAGGFIKQR